MLFAYAFEIFIVYDDILLKIFVWNSNDVELSDGVVKIAGLLR